jgi:hypothetical protein
MRLLTIAKLEPDAERAEKNWRAALSCVAAERSTVFRPAAALQANIRQGQRTASGRADLKGRNQGSVPTVDQVGWNGIWRKQPAVAPRRGPPSQEWRTFLRNHAPDLAAIDLFVVPTIGFDLLHAFVIVRLDRRDHLDQRHSQSDGRMGCTSDNGGVSLG